MRSFLSAVMAFAAMSTYAYAAVSTTNLVGNPGYEQGSFANWNSSGGSFVSTLYKRSGSYGAWVYQGPGSAYQDVDVSAFADAIDTGCAIIQAGGYIGGFNTVFLKRIYLDATNAVVASDEKSVDANGFSWVNLDFSNAPPKGTRSVRLQFDVRSLSEDADSGWDDVYLNVTYTKPSKFEAIYIGDATVTVLMTNLLVFETYSLESCNNLNSTNWSPVTNFVTSGTRTNITLHGLSPPLFFQLHTLL